MKFKLFLIVIMFVSLLTGNVSAISLPEKAQGKPWIFCDSKRYSDTWSKVAKERSWGECTNNPWHVYVCNDGIISYESYESSSAQLQRLDFMEDFYVAKIKGDYALLFYCRERLDGLVIPSSCRFNKSIRKENGRTNGYVGWVRIDDLLLWNTCPLTKNGICQKVAVVKDVVKVQKMETLQEKPRLYNAESCNVSNETDQGITDFDFLFLYKVNDDGNALVCVDYKMDNIMVSTAGDNHAKVGATKVGWIKYGLYILWDTRICWEVAFDQGFENEKLNDTARTFSSEVAAINYNIQKPVSKSVISQKPFPQSGRLKDSGRKQSSFPRSPILDYNVDNNVAEMAVIGNISGGMSIEERVKIRQQIDTLERSMSAINIVFVMDATRSMERSFSAMKKAVEDMTDERYSDRLKVKYGVVAYRNYEDAMVNDLDTICQLTEDVGKIANFLGSVKCKSVSNVQQEAMFHGLNKAAEMLRNPDESNFIILVTDVGSKSPDDRGFTESTIVKKMAEKNINLVAYQSVDNGGLSADFGQQVLGIIKNTLIRDGYAVNVKYDNKLRAFNFSQDDKWPLRPMACHIANSQNALSGDLHEFAVEIIRSFIDKTIDNIRRLNTSIQGGDIDPSVCIGLKEKFPNFKCEDMGTIRVYGYSKMYSPNDRLMFVPCLFMAQNELDNLIKELESITRNSSSGSSLNERKEVQQQCKKLLLSYSGQQRYANEIIRSIKDEDIDGIINSIESECGYEFYDDVKKFIKDPDKLNQDRYNVIVRRLTEGIDNLREVYTDPSSFFVQNGNKRYYYILLSDMPLVKKM